MVDEWIVNKHKGQFMNITAIDQANATSKPEQRDYFDGEVRTQMLSVSEEVEVMAVFFGPGERTHPHIHARDQVLHIVEGQGIVATETEQRIVNVGDVISIPAGLWHWHGATPDSVMCHISIKPLGSTNWGVEEKNWAETYDKH
jgi:quercetin dioxygenase-like cupin family protein